MANILTGNYQGNIYTVKYEFCLADDTTLKTGTLSVCSDDQEAVTKEVYRVLGVSNWKAVNPADRVSENGNLAEYNDCLTLLVPKLAWAVTVSEIVRKGSENTSAIISTRTVTETPGSPAIPSADFDTAEKKVTITWTPSSIGDEALYYIVYRGVFSDSGVDEDLSNYIQIGTSYSPTYTDADFDSPGIYVYRVQACNKGGTSAPSVASTEVTVWDTSLGFATPVFTVDAVATDPNNKYYLLLVFDAPTDPDNSLDATNVQIYKNTAGNDYAILSVVADDPADKLNYNYRVYLSRSSWDAPISDRIEISMVSLIYSFSPTIRAVNIKLEV